ncbi:MAG: hypothetical protein QOI57_166 [Rubrobacteraceae bacterium]|nr:hypothetical protein [Rubrobacteraceae bacterium]
MSGSPDQSAPEHRTAQTGVQLPGAGHKHLDSVEAALTLARRAAKTPGTAAGAVRGQPNRWLLLAVVAVGTFMTTLDTSIVNISLPTIAHTFGTTLSGAVEWVIIAYLVTIAASLLTFGRLSDMIGSKPIWTGGLALFTVGSILCGLAPSLGFLIAARAFEGLGAALIFAPSMAMITDAFPAAVRGRALGISAVVASLGISSGPTIGGFITEYLSWRWIFFVNVPIGVLGVLVALRVLPGSGRSGGVRFDPAGALLLGAGLALLTLGLSFGEEWGWTSAAILGALGTGVAALVAAVLVERRVKEPILDFSLLLGNRIFASALASFVLCMLALFAVAFMMPFYLEELRGFPLRTAGLLLTPLPLTVVVVGPISGSLADRFGSRVLAPLGLGVACVGLLLLGQLDAESSVGSIVWRLVVTGIGQGMFLSPNTRALMGAPPASERGEASGLLATGRVVGQSLSVAVAGAVFAGFGGTAAGNALAAHTRGGYLSAAALADLQQTFTGAFHAALLVSAALAATGVLTSLVRGDDRIKPVEPPEGEETGQGKSE